MSQSRSVAIYDVLWNKMDVFFSPDDYVVLDRPPTTTRWKKMEHELFFFSDADGDGVCSGQYGQEQVLFINRGE